MKINFNPIDEEVEKLNRRDFKTNTQERSRLTDTGNKIKINRNWDTDNDLINLKTNTPSMTATEKSATENRLSWPLKILAISLLFLFSASLFAFYQYKTKQNIVSDSNIVMFIEGKNYLDAGIDNNILINLTNKNKVDLKNTSIILEYVKSVNNNGEVEKILKRIDVGDIKSSESKNISEVITLYGSEGEIRKVKSSLEYKIEQSNAVYKKSVEKDFFIKEAPLEISIVGPKEVISGSEENVLLKVKNNSNTTYENVGVFVAYATGISFVSSDTENKNSDYFILGELKPKAEKEIKIKVKYTGSIGEEKTLNISVGRIINNSLAVLNKADFSSTISSNFLYLNISGINKENYEPGKFKYSN
jgi:hypothetical protein